jgi:hypothetical protein
MEHPNKEEEWDNEDEEPDEAEGSEQGNGEGDAHEIVPNLGEKRKDKGKGTKKFACKKRKSHRVPTIYTLTNDDIEKIGYQVSDVTKEAVQHVLQLQKNMNKKVQVHLMAM